MRVTFFITTAEEKASFHDRCAIQICQGPHSFLGHCHDPGRYLNAEYVIPIRPPFESSVEALSQEDVIRELREENDFLRVSLAAENDRLSRNELLERQNVELVTALKRCALVLSGEEMTKSSLVRALESARDVLAMIEGGE
jgi:hypothetical protein